MKKRRQWLLMGDIHADVGPIAYFYYHNKERLQLDDPNLTTRIILLGDVGANNFGIGVQTVWKHRVWHLRQHYQSFPLLISACVVITRQGFHR